MSQSNDFEIVYLDSTEFRAYKLADDEKNWLISEERPPEFWLQRQPLIGRYGGYIRRDELPDNVEIHPPKSYHGDRSHPPFV